MGDTLPPLALSVRQPWAWAIIYGGKVIENRSLGAIRSGNMDCRRIALHAAVGMTQKEYLWAVWRLDRHGVACPHPLDLPRGAIIGSVDVVDIVSESDSEWFGSAEGNHGLVLANPTPCDPIPAKGELGYFAWQMAEGGCAPAAPWMNNVTTARPAGETGDLFSDMRPSFKKPPERPFG